MWRSRQYVEHPEASKRHRLLHIAGRSSGVVRSAGQGGRALIATTTRVTLESPKAMINATENGVEKL